MAARRVSDASGGPDSDAPSSSTSVPSLAPGLRVLVQGKPGTVRFVGTTSFAPGRWIGVELDEPQGKNDGSVQGVPYFNCRALHGVFVRASQVKTMAVNESASDKGASGTNKVSSVGAIRVSIAQNRRTRGAFHTVRGM